MVDVNVIYLRLLTIGGRVLQFLTGDDVVFEDPADFATVSLPADPSSPLPAQLATADLHALLRVSTMLHSFHAMYRGRGSSPGTCWSGICYRSSWRSFPRPVGDSIL